MRADGKGLNGSGGVQYSLLPMPHLRILAAAYIWAQVQGPRRQGIVVQRLSRTKHAWCLHHLMVCSLVFCQGRLHTTWQMPNTELELLDNSKSLRFLAQRVKFSREIFPV